MVLRCLLGVPDRTDLNIVTDLIIDLYIDPVACFMFKNGFAQRGPGGTFLPHRHLPYTALPYY